MWRNRTYLLALPLLMLGANLQAAPTAAETPTAQTLLFDAAYLTQLAAPSRLTYHYSYKSADASLFGPSFDDEASMQLTPSSGAEGFKDVVLDIFSGERQREIGLPKVTGNPMIMMFLEQDASQMQKHVGGQMVYFRNVIRAAFRDTAKVEPVGIDWQGKAVKGMKITIQPFVNTPDAERLQMFRTKTYEFVVSDAVPGGIYDIRSMILDSREGQTAPAIDAHLTLKGIDYDQAKN